MTAIVKPIQKTRPGALHEMAIVGQLFLAGILQDQLDLSHPALEMGRVISRQHGKRDLVLLRQLIGWTQ